MKLFSLIMLFISALGLSACVATPNYQGQAKPLPANNSMSGRWFLTSFNHAGYQGPRLTLEFDGKNRASGFSGCNRYFGPANIQMNGGLNFGLIGSTRRACSSMQNSRLESNYLKALSQVQSYQLNGNRLVLKGNATHLVFFRKGMK